MKYINIIFLVMTLSTTIMARSPHRPQDQTMPEIITCWTNDIKKYSIKSYYLQEYPLFEIFDYEHFFSHYLPIGKIKYRYNPKQNVNGSVIAHLVDELVDEINQKKRLHKIKRFDDFKNFTVLRQRNFNRRKKCGFLILKCKHYPFVVKLSVETPESFTQPFKKGFEPSIFFVMAGGINRHLSGFTRIKNAAHVRTCIEKENLPVEFDMPRKWFYVPQNSKWIKLTGKNIGTQPSITTEIPGTYCIIADAIEFERKFTLLNNEDCKISMNFCNLVNFSIDPHIDNFLLEKNTGKVVIVDTEHFPSITGLVNIKGFYTSQLRWYADLTVKCIQDMFLRDKKTRKHIQKHGTHHFKL